MTTVKTCSEHEQYLYGIVRLKFFFLWHWLREHPEEDVSFVLRNRVDIYRKTDVNPEGLTPQQCHWDDPRWLSMEAATEQLYQIYSSDKTAYRFEDSAFAIFAPSIQARVPRDYADRSSINAYTFGSIRFDQPSTERPNRISFHIANTQAPRSIFADPAYLPHCLLETMQRAEAAYEANELETFTWLNSHPRWLELFPDEWQLHCGPPDNNIQWHYGYWGQFINARSVLNEKLAHQLRETGHFPYLPRHTWCTFTALRRHLQRYLAEHGVPCAM